MAEPMLVGLSPDFLAQGQALVASSVRERLADVPRIDYLWLPDMGPSAVPEEIDGVDAVLSLGIRYPASSFGGLRRLALISRWGVGYDMIDVEACTSAGVALAIAPESITRPVAEGALTLTLALLKRLPDKDQAVRQGRWRGQLPAFGHSSTGVVLGCIGLGNIGGEFMRLARAFAFRRLLAHDPFVPPERAQELGAELVDLDILLRQSDVVAIHCPLSEGTYHLIGERELRLMKPTAYLVNTARGPIVDQAALTAALREGTIAGAGLDVLEKEPPDPDDPLLQLDNVIFAPHAIAWTEELMHELTLEALQACIDLASGHLPQNIVNSEVVDHPGFQAKLARIGGLS